MYKRRKVIESLTEYTTTSGRRKTLIAVYKENLWQKPKYEGRSAGKKIWKTVSKSLFNRWLNEGQSSSSVTTFRIILIS